MLIVTVCALLMAATLGWVALRLLREEQRRSEARVAVLTAALDAGPALGERDDRMVTARPAAWTTMTDASARRPYQHAAPTIIMLDDTSSTPAFASETTHKERVAPVTASPAPLGDDRTLLGASPSSVLFTDVPAPRATDIRRVTVVGGVGLAVLSVVAYLWLLGQPAQPPAVSETARHAVALAAHASVAGVPLELMTLGHDQRAGSLTVRGLVRNPVSGSTRQGVAASVFLLDQVGGFLGSARAPIDAARLQPGDEVGFSVKVPADARVRRYRVTFRAPDGSLVAHEDRRNP